MKKLLSFIFLLFFVTACDGETDYTQNTWDGGILNPANNCKPLPEDMDKINKMSVDERGSRSFDCRFPPPPIGRWHAVYTKDFAKKYNLPPENISDDFSAGVEYMEMEVVPYGRPWDRGCFAKMLVKRPNDISYLIDPRNFSISALPSDFKFSHYFDFQHIRNDLRRLLVSSASRDYEFNKSGFMRTTRGLFFENVIDGYDYVIAQYGCRQFSMNPQYFPDGYAFRVRNASVMGKHIPSSKEFREQKKEDGFPSHQFVHIPEEIISNLYKNINFRGK